MPSAREPEEKQAGYGQAAGQFPVIVEQHRCGDAREQAAERTAERHRQVEAREMRRRRARPGEFAVAEHADDEKRRAEHRDHCRDRQVAKRRVEVPRQCRRDDQDQRPEKQAPIPEAAVETQHEGQQIECQRDDPQQRHRGHVLRDVSRHGEQRNRAQCREHEPQQHVRQARWRGGRRQRCRSRGWNRIGFRPVRPQRPCHHPGRSHCQKREQGESRRPCQRLRPHRESRLEHERIDDERDQRCKIRKREKPVDPCLPHAVARMQTGDPALHQRPGGADGEVRQSDGRGQYREHAERRIGVAGRGLPDGGRNDGQRRARREQQHRMDAALDAQGPAGKAVGVEVAEQEHDLEEHQAQCPDRSRSAKPRQDLSGDQRLHQEQQEGGNEDGRCAERCRATVSRAP